VGKRNEFSSSVNTAFRNEIFHLVFNFIQSTQGKEDIELILDIDESLGGGFEVSLFVVGSFEEANIAGEFFSRLDALSDVEIEEFFGLQVHSFEFSLGFNTVGGEVFLRNFFSKEINGRTFGLNALDFLIELSDVSGNINDIVSVGDEFVGEGGKR
jgi:hypothetical protein